jgi:hypothetical protein
VNQKGKALRLLEKSSIGQIDSLSPDVTRFADLASVETINAVRKDKTEQLKTFRE